MTHHRMPSERRSFLTQLERELCAAGHQGAVTIVRRVSRGFIGQGRLITRRDAVFPDELALAVTLLDSGMCRPDARTALMVRLQASRAKAYRLISAALRVRSHGFVPPTQPDAAGLRQLALALDDEGD